MAVNGIKRTWFETKTFENPLLDHQFLSPKICERIEGLRDEHIYKWALKSILKTTYLKNNGCNDPFQNVIVILFTFEQGLAHLFG